MLFLSLVRGGCYQMRDRNIPLSTNAAAGRRGSARRRK